MKKEEILHSFCEHFKCKAENVNLNSGWSEYQIQSPLHLADWLFTLHESTQTPVDYEPYQEMTRFPDLAHVVERFSR